MSETTENDKKKTSLKDEGIYLLMDNINRNSAKPVIEWILEENLQSKKRKNLTLIINSPGGEVRPGFAIIDTMKGSSIPIHTVGLGEISSCGFMIFITGKKGHRILTPNTTILSHQYSWGSIGKQHELLATVKQFNITGDRILNHYKECSGLTEKKIKKHLLPESDCWLTADEALELGVCDEIKDLK